MRITELLWTEDRIEHIARHNVRPHEVEEVCFGNPAILHGKSEGKNPVYYVLGITLAGRHLFCVVIGFPNDKGFPVTARPMTNKEERRFKQLRRN